MDDLESLADGAARARDEPVHRPGAEPHRGRARVGARGGRRRPGVPGLLPDLPGPDRARRVRADPARGVPGQRSRQLHRRARGRRRLDDLQHASSGTSTGPTRGCSRPCWRCCSTWPTAGIDVLRLDAAPFLWKRLGHQLPEPAGGPSDRAGAARPGPDRCARRRVQGRGDRRAGRPGAVPRRPRALPSGVRPGLSQPAHGDALVLDRHPGRAPGHHRAAPAAARAASSRAGSPTCAATTTSAGPSPTRTPGRSAGTRTSTGASWRRSSPAAPRAASRAARSSRRTRPPATPAPPAAPRPCAGSSRRCSTATRRRSPPAYDGCSCSTPSSTPSAVSRWSTWATSWACSATRPGPACRPRPRDNRWMHRPHMDWSLAERRHDPATVEGRVFAGVRELGATRRTVPSFGLGGATQLLDAPGPAPAGLPAHPPARRRGPGRGQRGRRPGQRVAGVGGQRALGGRGRAARAAWSGRSCRSCCTGPRTPTWTSGGSGSTAPASPGSRRSDRPSVVGAPRMPISAEAEISPGGGFRGANRAFGEHDHQG